MHQSPRWLLPMVAAIAIFVGSCASESPTTPTPGVRIETPVATPTPTAEQVSTTLRGFTFPIAGGCLPTGNQLMPNAPREYRKGVHEGVDVYDSDGCAQVSRGTPVIAAKGGHVIRADLDYKDVTYEELARNDANPNSEAALDSFRGRQVWIDHGLGVITRYAHLEGIATGITRGASVAAGQLIAFVGESGTPESLTAPGTEYHLHFEVRIGDSFLGNGLPTAEVRRLYRDLFSP